MNGLTTLRIELNMASHKIQQQLVLRDEMLESEVQRGIDMAFSDLTKDDTFALLVRDQVLKELQEITKNSLSGYKMKNRLTDIVNNKVSSKLDELAENISQKVLSSFVI